MASHSRSVHLTSTGLMYARALGSYFELIHRSVRNNIIDKGQTGTIKATLSKLAHTYIVSHGPSVRPKIYMDYRRCTIYTSLAHRLGKPPLNKQVNHVNLTLSF